MITFDEAAHRYTVDGVEVPSVTEVCRFLSYDQKSDKPWLAKAAADRGTRIHAACAAIDSLEWEEVLGTIAGDDTIFILCKSEEQAKSFTSKLRLMLNA